MKCVASCLPNYKKQGAQMSCDITDLHGYLLFNTFSLLIIT